jgi:hypothetical protein
MSTNQTESSEALTAREKRAAHHLSHVNYHRGVAAEHAQRREATAKRCHLSAATAHEKLTDGRYDPLAQAAALEFSVIANSASYEARRARPPCREQAPKSGQLGLRDATERKPITPEQLRAARLLLGWTRFRVARVSNTTTRFVVAFESSGRVRRILWRPRDFDSLGSIRAALEVAGVEFADENGEDSKVRLREARS